MRLKSLFLNSLKKVDFFGVPIQFTLNDKTLQKSYFGGLLSIILFSILIAILHQSIRSLIYREQVTSFSEEANHQDPPAVNLDSFRLNMAITYSDRRMNNGTYFKIDVYQAYTLYTKENNTIARQKNLIPLEKCTTDNFRNDMQEAFLSLADPVSIKSFLCPKKSTLFEIQGNALSPDFTYFQIKVSACVNSSSVTCASQKEIDKIFADNGNKIYLDFFVSNNVINPKNFDNPVSSFFDDKMYIMLDRKNYKEKNFYLTKNVIMTDKNFLDSSYEEEFSTYTYENLYDENTFNLDAITNTTVYAGVYFRAHSLVKTHYRTSVKLGTYASYIGGLWSIMYVFFGFIGERFNNERVKIKLANYLYDFKGEKEKKRLLAKFQQKTSLMKGSIEEKIGSFLSIGKEWKLPYEENFILKKLFTRNKENIHVIDTLREKAKKAVHKDLDVVHLLRKLKSSDKLRHLILNKDQNFVFEFFHKTEINYINDSHLKSRSSRMYDSNRSKIDPKIFGQIKDGKLKDLMILHDCYQRLKKEGEKNSLNLRIIKEIRPEILEIFLNEENKVFLTKTENILFENLEKK